MRERQSIPHDYFAALEQKTPDGFVLGQSDGAGVGGPRVFDPAGPRAEVRAQGPKWLEIMALE